MVPDHPDLLSRALIALANPTGPTDDVAATALLGGADEPRFLRAVFRHRLQGALADVADRVGSPIGDGLRAAVDDDRLTRLRVSAVLGRVARAFDDAEIPWLTFKGLIISSLMDRPELRAFNDLDLLVAADRFADSLEVLAEVGVEEINRNWAPYLRYGVGELPLSAGGISIDLHWHLIGLARTRRTIHLPPGELLARRRSMFIGDIAVSTLDREDQLLHLAVHSALSGATRLDQLRDIAVVFGAEPVDPACFLARARSAGVARLVAHALDRARVILGAPVDEEFVRELGGSTVWLRRRLDRGSVDRLRGILVTPSRDSIASTLRAVGTRVGERALSLVGRNPGWDFTDADGRLHYDTPSGGAEIRAEYLQALRTWT